MILVASGPVQREKIVSISYESPDQASYVVRASNTPEAPVPVTLTVEFDLLNVTADRPVPVTLVLRQAGEFDLVKLTRTVLSLKWQFDYDSHWYYGDRDAYHSGDPYRLPYTSGHTATVSQGSNGTSTHRGPEAYAIDFAMPKGTPVRAAREGLVVDTQDDVVETVRNLPVGHEGGVPTNSVLILHDDGTVARYLHLRLRGIKVRRGQVVRAGDFIGFSGDTGLSGGPHLHFDVYKPVDGYNLETLPVRFEVAGEAGPVELQQGRAYEAR